MVSHHIGHAAAGALLVMTAIAATPLRADPLSDACRQYAAVAAEQNQVNHGAACGLTGARWSDDTNGHLRWCLAAGPGPAAAETQARRTALAQCRATRPRQMASTDYQSIDQKANQLYNLLGAIMKAIQQMHGEPVGGMLRSPPSRRLPEPGAEALDAAARLRQRFV